MFVWGMALLCGLCGVFLYLQIEADYASTREIMRNFYGTLRSRDKVEEGTNDRKRQLKHGAILHGEQYLGEEKRRVATTYYSAVSGVGRAILTMQDHHPLLRIGVIGMGTATLAIYGRSGDYQRFYEINPQVIDLAQREFTFLKDGLAKTDIILGDARLSLEGEPLQNFDLLVVDAFSGDSVPAHLLTREAMKIYLRHLKPEGVIAFHVTNRFLTLSPVVRILAEIFKMETVRVYDEAEDSFRYRSDWVLVSRNHAFLTSAAFSSNTIPIEQIADLQPWTDDFNNLFDVLK